MKISQIKFSIVLVVIFLFANKNTFAQNTLPLIQIEDFEYQGAFNIPGGHFGESQTNYCAGAISYNSTNHSIFFAGYKNHGAIAEFAIPTLVNSTDATMLNDATILQDFKRILDGTPDGNPQLINRVSSMKIINGRLIVNAVEYYDAPANNTHTTLVLEDASNIANSAINGYYELEGAAHAAGWISPIPSDWQTLLGGSFISGHSSRFPINGRLAMGVSAFVFDPADLSGAPSGVIPTTTLLDYDLSNPLYADYSAYQNAHYNLVEVNGTTGPGHTFADADAIVGTNNLWTSSSQASYGFIIPGSRTYFSIGSSGGHHSGIGYKATQNNGNLCGGPCSYDADDNYNYYWLWDVNDLLAVKNGTLNPYDVRPYAYGVFDAPFQLDIYSNTPEYHPIVGGDYDPVSGLLYLTIYDGASTGRYERRPVIAAYKLREGTLSISEENINLIIVYPTPSSTHFTLKSTLSEVATVTVYNSLGQKITTFKDVSLLNGFTIDVNSWASGIYYCSVTASNQYIGTVKMIVAK